MSALGEARAFGNGYLPATKKQLLEAAGADGWDTLADRYAREDYEQALEIAAGYRAALAPGMATARAKMSAQEVGEKVLAMLHAAEMDRRIAEQMRPEEYRDLMAPERILRGEKRGTKSTWEHDREMIGFLGGLQAEIGSRAPRPQTVKPRSEASSMNDCEIPTNRKGE